ncbi:hypothetical protein TPSD3_15820 [Thioflexithrix psekupsensis]|uniref:Guanylate cyclase domain-containing protein n=2 Tax=Thioflexithrix psekupsensis TaxID=1570016 RepID=A0A251X5Y2_9GAMM|nr:hypothetical protein TPSD3_15820 [Thioflexithrix psekupsensis]
MSASANTEVSEDVLFSIQQLMSQAQQAQIREDNQTALTLQRQASELLQLHLPDSALFMENSYFLAKLHYDLGSYVQALASYEKVSVLAGKLGDKEKFAAALLGMSMTLWRQDNYQAALEHGLNALRAYQELDHRAGIADALHNIGTINDILKNYDKALEYHQQALVLREQLQDRKAIAESLNAMGIVYYFSKNYEKAAEFYEKTLAILMQLEDDKGVAKLLNNLGLVYKEQGDYDKAINYFFQTLDYANKLGNKYEIVNVSNNIGKLFILKADYDQAELFLHRALKIAEEIEAKDLIRESSEYYSDLFVANNDYEKALFYFKKAAQIRRELLDENRGKAIADLQTKYETEQKAQEIALLQRENNIKQLELERQTLLRNGFLIGFGFVLLMAMVAFYLYIVKKKAHHQLSELYSLISQEKAKSDQLLLNILPSRVANDLKEFGKTEPELFENVTVFFSDIVSFTKTSEKLDVKVLIEELNDIFTAFDNIVERNHCERIKTIGDAYLCVCGMPEENPQHAYNIVRAAVEIIQYMQQRNAQRSISWQIRVGIHTGPVVGGVVGVKKYIYDVFGDTINTTSRMEANSEPMKINISSVTYAAIQGQFKTQDRGEIDAKGKGKMRMYFVETDSNTALLNVMQHNQ